MAKFTIKATARVALSTEIEANTPEEAREIFFNSSYEDILLDADKSAAVGVDVDGIEKTEEWVTAFASRIEYDPDDASEADPEEWPEGLPISMTVRFPCDPKRIREGVQDEIEDETRARVRGFDLRVISEE